MSRQQLNYYVKLTGYELDRLKHLSGSCVLIYAQIKKFSNGCYLNQDQLSENTGLSINTIKRGIKHLREVQIISYERRGKRNFYTAIGIRCDTYFSSNSSKLVRDTAQNWPNSLSRISNNKKPDFSETSITSDTYPEKQADFLSERKVPLEHLKTDGDRSTWLVSMFFSEKEIKRHLIRIMNKGFNPLLVKIQEAGRVFDGSDQEFYEHLKSLVLNYAKKESLEVTCGRGDKFLLERSPR